MTKTQTNIAAMLKAKGRKVAEIDTSHMTDPVKLLSANDKAFIDDAWKRFVMAENERLFICTQKLTASLLTILDAVDYTTGACQCTEMVGAVLDKCLIAQAREAIRFQDRANRPTAKEGK